MAISDAIERLGKSIFEAPFGGSRLAKDTPELAEIRLAVLDAVKAKSYRAGGRSVFPYDLIRIRLLGVPAEQAAMFRGEFLANYFAAELKSALERSSQRFSEELRVELLTSPDLPLKGQEWVHVEVQTDARPAVEAAATAPVARRAKLVVVNASANRSEILLNKNRINIGRTLDVYRGAAPSRRNDLAFSEENEINRTVSREHAHVNYSQKTGEYRLFNDRTYKGDANCGIWIVREGMSQAVHRGSRGTLLMHGDEIHLGSAILRFVGK